MEERRMRTDSNPIGKLIEEFLTTAYKAHPYKEPTIGFPSDLNNFTRKDAIEFFQKYYQPSNLTSVIVGDVDPKEVKRLAEIYFGRFPAVRSRILCGQSSRSRKQNGASRCE